MLFRFRFLCRLDWYIIETPALCASPITTMFWPRALVHDNASHSLNSTQAHPVPRPWHRADPLKRHHNLPFSITFTSDRRGFSNRQEAKDVRGLEGAFCVLIFVPYFAGKAPPNSTPILWTFLSCVVSSFTTNGALMVPLTSYGQASSDEFCSRRSCGPRAKSFLFTMTPLIS